MPGLLLRTESLDPKGRSMNNIAKEQNKEKYLTYLAAQRQLYSEDKMWTTVLLLLPFFLVVIGNLTYFSTKYDFYKPIITLFSIIYAVSDLTVFSILTRRKRNTAAIIQELFDCELLDIPWNGFIGEKPDSRLIQDAHKRFVKKNPMGIDKLHNWYNRPIPDKSLSLSEARTLCQEQSISWDSAQRHKYGVWVMTISSGFALLFLIGGVVLNLSFRNVLEEGPILLGVTAIISAIRHGLDHLKAANKLKTIEKGLQEIKRTSKNKRNKDEVLLQHARNIQTELFHHRSENIPVFDWVYNKFKKNNE